jgi:PAS domain S-box-containing protein
MKIAQQSMLVVLACVLGGLLTSIIIGVKSYQLQKVQEMNTENLLLLRDVKHQKLMLSQWFVTIDLFFSQQDSYLESGISIQASQLLKMLNVKNSELNESYQFATQQEFQPLHKDILQTSKALFESISQVAALIKSSSTISTQSQKWKENLAHTDKLSSSVIILLNDLQAQYQQLNNESKKILDEKKNNLPRISIMAILMYLLMVFWAWRLASRSIIKPLVSLNRKANKSLNIQSTDDTQKINFRLKKGPEEVVELSHSLQRYAQSLQQQIEQANQARLKSTRDKNYISSIMNSITDSIITLDEHGIIKNSNSATYTMFDTTSDKLHGFSINVILPKMYITYNEMSKLVGSRIEKKIKTKQGNNRSIEILITKAAHKKNKFFILSIHDTSKRIENENNVKRLNQRLVSASRKVGVAEMATSILHNVGNILNSVHVSTNLISDTLKNSRIKGINKLASIMSNKEDFFNDKDKVEMIPEYLYSLSSRIDEEREITLKEITLLNNNINHIEEIISSQQQYASTSSAYEWATVSDLIEDAININREIIDQYNFNIIKEYENLTEVNIEKFKVMQILVNLITNAKDAILESKNKNPTIILRVRNLNDKTIEITVQDNGIGVSEEINKKIFSYGFTTKKAGHGFGLHSCALTAKEMGGKLIMQSNGHKLGAKFILTIPKDNAPKSATVHQIRK